MDDHRYDDILPLTRPVSARRRMTGAQRAAQFAPFAALTGFDDAIEETARSIAAQAERQETDETPIPDEGEWTPDDEKWIRETDY